MRFVDIIEKKKQKQALTKEEIHFFIDGYVHQQIPDYQVSALLMAIYFNGMNLDETSWLTEEMLYSGECIDLSNIPGIKCDKHSTGGVGDKTSLTLAPLVSACGAKIAKMSGRGLGHTGGTLDKLESIPGFQIELDQASFVHQVNEIGIAIIGQSADVAPADKKLYALRDVTGTVNSIPLIASSIMSKKLAAGSDTILLDVKYGEGAFMPTAQDALELAHTMMAIGKHFHKDVRAMITNMNQPLGNAIGNALEVKEAIATLKGEGPKDFTELCLKAGSIMLLQAKLVDNEEEAMYLLQAAIHNGSAFAQFKKMVIAQHGDVAVIDDLSLLSSAKEVIAIHAKKEGYVQELHALELGTLAMKLGAGRMVKEDAIDPSVGIILQKKRGDYVACNDILAYVHTNHELTDDWRKDFDHAFEISDVQVEAEPLIHQVVME